MLLTNVIKEDPKAEEYTGIRNVKKKKKRLTKEAKLVNVHRARSVAFQGHNLHFYEQESFALLSVSYNLQSCKMAQRQGSLR